MSLATSDAVSAIVVAYRTGDIVRQSLASLAAQPEIAEIIIVDNGDDPAERAFFTAWAAAGPGRILIAGHGNVGFAAGVNRGAASATGAYLLCLNPDAVLRSGAVAALLADSAGLREPFVLGGVLFDAEGREQAGARRHSLTLWRALMTGSGLARLGSVAPIFAGLDARRGPLPAERVRIGAISGALFLMSAAGFAILRGLDEGYFLHVEDIDLCARARKAGGEVALSPQARAFHGRSTSAAPRLWVEMRKADGFERYFSTHAHGLGARVAAALIMPILRAGLWLRAVWPRSFRF